MDSILDTGRVDASGAYQRHYTYINGEPCLVLLPKVKRMGANGFAVRLDDAWRWRTDNEDIGMVIHAARIAARQFQLDPDPHTLFGIITAIQDGIEDLLAMPPKPEERKQANAELLVVVNGTTYRREVAV